VKVFDDWLEVMAKGDWMMWVLVSISLMLWYSIGFRAFLLVRGTRQTLSELLAAPPPWVEGERKRFRGFIVEAAAAAAHVRDRFPRPWGNAMDGYLFPLSERMKSLRSLVAALIGLAPMAGLLGTVSGMMVMFESLGNSNFSSQTSGIAHGISQALFTTEAALIIAVPCLILGQILNRKEDAMRKEIEQIKKILCGAGA